MEVKIILKLPVLFHYRTILFASKFLECMSDGIII